MKERDMWGTFMDSQKIENILNLSLDVTEMEREKSQILGVGFDETERTWELIIKYHGDIMRAASDVVRIEPLIPGYAIVTIIESLIESFTGLEEVEYIEKPKRLYFSVLNGKRASCVPQVTDREPFLTGKNTITCIIDSGIDYYSREFRNEDGTTRILRLWDQTLIPNAERGQLPPEGFFSGVEFTREQINEALAQPSRREGEQIVPSRDISGHGTAVAGIAAGRSGVAPESQLLIVKLGNPREDSFPRTTELMRALAYCINTAVFYGMPVAVNLSFGNTYGDHRGTSLLERYIDNVSEMWKCVICIGSGNEGASRGHTGGQIEEGRDTTVELAIAEFETSLNLQLWKNYVDTYTVEIISPSGQRIPIDWSIIETLRVTVENTQLLIYAGKPAPYSLSQELFIDFIPLGDYISSGIWSFVLHPVRIVTGEFDFYLPSAVTRNIGTGFFMPLPDVTLTIPSTSAKAITVGAYDADFQSYVDFSGRGYVFQNGESIASGNGAEWIIGMAKPDLVAPGVNITSVQAGGGSFGSETGSFTGTSFAVPFVTGSAALMMEWGIVRGNDIYLYGEKLKAYLIRGARELTGGELFPNPMLGWGALCLADSIPL